MAEICFQRAPGQDLAQKGRFPRVPEGDFNCRPKGLQMAEICFLGIFIAGPKALKLPKFASNRLPGQDLAQKGSFLRVPEGNFNCRSTKASSHPQEWVPTWDNTDIHTYIHTYVHTYIHACSHVHTCTYMYKHTYIHAYIHTYMTLLPFTFLRVAYMYFGYLGTDVCN